MADPRDLGAGTHYLRIVCMDYDGFSDTRNLKVILPIPPPPVSGPLKCNLTLIGPTPQGLLVALFNCDRRVFAMCQVSGRAPESCKNWERERERCTYHAIIVQTTFYLIFYFLRQLSKWLIRNQHSWAEQRSALVHLECWRWLWQEPHESTPVQHRHRYVWHNKGQEYWGQRLFYLFYFPAHRKCCPVINTQQSSITFLSEYSHVLLDLRVGAGNCTENEGFR